MIEYLLPPNRSQSQYLSLNLSISANWSLSKLHLHLGLSLIISLFLKLIQSLSLSQSDLVSLLIGLNPFLSNQPAFHFPQIFSVRVCWGSFSTKPSKRKGQQHGQTKVNKQEKAIEPKW